VAASLLLVALVVAMAWAGLHYARIARELEPASRADRDAIGQVIDPVEDLSSAGPIYILVLGADARPGETRSRSDTIILTRVDVAKRAVSMISIPRDSRVPVEGHGLDKINHANAYGGAALAIKTVQAYTGLPVNHYIELDFEGFTALVDAVGGVTVRVDQATTGIPAGTQRLDAAQALTFVRSRAYPDGDFTRVRNQQKFLVAFAKQALSRGNLIRLPSTAEAVADNVETDMTVTELLQLAFAMKGIDDDDITGTTVPGTTATIGGISYVIPDEAAASVLFEQFRAGSVPSTGQ
jgi:LCP family protein required for cell wall assembly